MIGVVPDLAYCRAGAFIIIITSRRFLVSAESRYKYLKMALANPK
jgi:hypothetical protein